jgi:hypothetical protein
MNWPEQKVVVRLTAQLATKVRQAFKSAMDGDAIAQSWADTHPVGGSVSPQTARDWALAHAITNEKPLQHALARVYADGYTLGAKVAQTRLNGLKKDVSAGVVDWSTWKPGLPSAAALVKPTGGLKQLLDSRKITVANEITRTKLDRIGSALAKSLSQGATPKETAKAINAIIGDPQHALTIAQTEMNRAMSVASRDSYEKSGVEQVEWLVAEGCEDCQENADASPIGIDETFPTGDSEPPAHPNCMCAIAPVFNDMELPAEGDVPEEFTFEDFVSQSEDFVTSITNEEPVTENADIQNAALLANKIYEKASAVEPEITNIMEVISNKLGANLTGLEYKLKTVDSLNRKILDVANEKFNGDLKMAAENISDAVRYTMLTNSSKYMETVNSAVATLKRKGYSAVVKNTWKPNSAYKGINVALVSPSGQRLELQFHTAKSLSVKGKIHPMYEEWRVLDPNSSKAETLMSEMIKLSSSLVTPPGA